MVGIVLIALAAVAGDFTLYMLCSCARRTGKTTYAEVRFIDLSLSHTPHPPHLRARVGELKKFLQLRNPVLTYSTLREISVCECVYVVASATTTSDEM